MELRQLRCVEAVARHRHFTRAAEELHVAQSALSHQIQRLERELGTPLFERTSRRVIPTDAGRVIAARARRVFAELDGAREEVDDLRGVRRGRIWIGALLPAGAIDVPGLLARFSQAHPGVEIGLREGIADDMFRRLAADELDAAFCLLAGEIPDELAVERLSHDEVVAAFAPDPRQRRNKSRPRISASSQSWRCAAAQPSPTSSTSGSPRPAGHSTSPSRAAIRSSSGRSLLAASLRPSCLGRSLHWAGPPSRFAASTPLLICLWRSSGAANACSRLPHAHSSNSSAARQPPLAERSRRRAERHHRRGGTGLYSAESWALLG